jgi:hypothetical protein
MNIRTLALVLGSAMVVAASGVAATACSSSSGGNGSSSSSGGTADSGHTDGTASSSGGGDSGGSSSGGEGGSSSGGSDGGAGGPDCGTTPSVHATEAGTIYCGFTDAGNLDCPLGQQCCLGGSLGTASNSPFAPEECATLGSTCTNGGGDAGSQQPVPIVCADVADCRANGNSSATACCLQGASCASGFTCGSTAGTCPFPKYSHGTAIVCEGDAGGAATACASGETQLCASDTDCANGLHCVPGKWKIFQLGFCQ